MKYPQHDTSESLLKHLTSLGYKLFAKVLDFIWA